MSSIYLHVPFCSRKCPYCDFFSVEGHAAWLQAYPRALIEHLRLYRHPAEEEIETVFFGGGTPSLLSPGEIAGIIDEIAGLFPLSSRAEITLEANPGTLTRDSLRSYRQAGVNRLSLGIQSFNPQLLHTLGRIHSPEQAENALLWAREAGFSNLSLDLMFGLPGQSGDALEAELERIIGYSPEHVSLYGLTIEEGTPFFDQHRKGQLSPADDETSAGMYLDIDARLSAAGFGHYEISNFARPGFESRHNLGYWQRRGNLGIGAGAHSFFDDGWGRRMEVPADIERYFAQLEQSKDPAVLLETFDRAGAMSETLYLGLRTAEGVDDRAFCHRFGVTVAEAFPLAIERCGRHLRLIDGKWRMNLAGWLIFDRLILEFL